ncbi:MAG: insulinase family protein [Bacteroidia bacterium]|nr:insulinase family protein [Bacteroidia bacterium]
MNRITLISLAICIAFVTSAQTKPADGPKKTALNYEYALNDPYNARIYTLKNGLKVYLSVYKNAPRIQTYIAVKAGSKNDPSNATGLAHYLEHMLFKGTDKFGTKDAAKETEEIKKIENLYETYRKTTDEAGRKKTYHQIDSISGVAAKLAIANEYDKMLAAIGAQGTNAFTSFDQTVYVNDIPSNQIDNWLKIEAERFRKPVLRLFHTELEAVYEEKNRGLDNDNVKSYEAAFAAIFPKNKYGTQTTIGTIDHLKNPSMTEINNYYQKWYAPNNMAIIMSGDFDPDKVITQIEKHFNSAAAKPLEAYTPAKEDAIAARIVRDVYGPDPESMNIIWRTEGEGTKEVDMLDLIVGILSNGKAGLMDINLNQAQKVMGANSYVYPLKDYGIFALGASPKQNQKLEELEGILYSQIELIQKGEFPDWLMKAVITDMKLSKTKELEDNGARAGEMLDAFVNDVKWQKQVDKMERMSKITKQEIIDYANKAFNKNNYVVVFKRIGEDKNVQKVEKPQITPVDVDRDNMSPFVKGIYEAKTSDILPKFVDYATDIKKGTLASNISVIYNKNTENKVFELYYKFDMGNNNDKIANIAVKYIDYVGTADMTPAQIKQELYKLGCSFNVFSDNEDTWISLNGLSDNFEASLKLFEKVLANPTVETETLKNMIEDIKKEREDAKQQKGMILNRGLVSYARFGAMNPFTNQLSNEDLDKLTSEDIKNKIKGLSTFEHKVLYYGPAELTDVTKSLNAVHVAPAGGYKPVPASQKFEFRTITNEVFVVDYDMKQAEIIMLNQGGVYNKGMIPLLQLYNTYFGDGMSGVVFQDLRESKALAYSVYSRYVQPNKPSKQFYNVSYIGSQVDKLQEAMKGMTDLLTEIPKSEASFSASKENLLQEIRSQRINKADILFNYLDAQQMGLTNDIRKDVYEKVNLFKYEDVKKFHADNVKGKNITVLVIGKKDNLDMKVLEKYGPVKVLTLKEIFGY